MWGEENSPTYNRAGKRYTTPHVLSFEREVHVTLNFPILILNNVPAIILY